MRRNNGQYGKSAVGTRRWAVPLGFCMLALALVGLVSLVTIIVAAAGNASRAKTAQALKRYEQLLKPVVMLDPPTFEKLDSAPDYVILQSSILDALDRNANANLAYDETGKRLLPLSEVEASCHKLWGDRPLEPSSFEIQENLFEFDELQQVYHIPSVGFGNYRPLAEKFVHQGGKVEVTVGYIPIDSVMNTPEKRMVYVLEGDEGSETITAIRQN